MNILPGSFYRRDDVVCIAKETLGKYLVTKMNGEVTSGIIVETEAYAGVRDRASHAYEGRKTARTSVMYENGGVAYVYLCYGIHSLFNLVTNGSEIPDAVLVRGIIPADGLDVMVRRSGKPVLSDASGIGPGNVSRLLGIHYTHTGIDLTAGYRKNHDGIWLEERNYPVCDDDIEISSRIGVAYAGDHASWPYRFRIKRKGCFPFGKQPST